jgi:hypothetical protein
MTFAHCIHSMFTQVFHKDFILIWCHFLPALFCLWQFVALQLGISHYYSFAKLSSTHVTISASLLLIASWLLMKTFYYLFYCISYKAESDMNRLVKIFNQILIFSHSIFLTYSLFNHLNAKQYELGYLTIFIICTLFVLNVVVTLNPISREDSVDLNARGCCSSNNIMPTISFLFCFQVLELHHFLAATEEQNL